MAASYNLLRLAPFNPILLRVVTAGGRRLRHAFTRWGYLALLMLVYLIAYVGGASEAGANASLSDMAKASSQVFSFISYTQLGMICLLAPVFCAAAITQERDSQTYNILLATPLSNAQIVIGSLFSRLYYVIALLLSGAPVFAITLLYGGVTSSSIILSFAIALSTALFTGSLAIAIAVFRLGSGKTVFWFYVFNAIYLVALLFIDQVWLSYDSAKDIHHTTWLTSIHPFLALRSVVSPTAYPTPDLSSLAGANSLVRMYFAHPAYAYVGLTTLASLVLVVPSAIVLRRVAQRTEAGLWPVLQRLLWRSKEGRTRRARNVWENPVAWREGATRAGFSGRGLMRWLTIIVGLTMALGLLYLYHKDYHPDGWETKPFIRDLLLGLILVEFSVALLVATNTSASAVTKERESKTLDLLLVTPITSRYYIWGKLRGLVSFMLPFAAVPTATVLLVVLYDFCAGLHFASTGAPALDANGLPLEGLSFWGRAFNDEWIVNWETVLSLPVLLTALLAWACMLGLQLSLKWSRTIVAVMASVGVLAGISAVLGLCGFVAARDVKVLGSIVALCSPFSSISVLIDPARFAPADFGDGGSVTYGGGAATAGRVVIFIATLAVSAAYCLIVWGMYRSMVKNFDMIIRRQHQ